LTRNDPSVPVLKLVEYRSVLELDLVPLPVGVGVGDQTDAGEERGATGVATADRIATANAPLPAASIQPTGAAYHPRSNGSVSWIVSSARSGGSPPTAGSVERLDEVEDVAVCVQLGRDRGVKVLDRGEPADPTLASGDGGRERLQLLADGVGDELVFVDVLGVVEQLAREPLVLGRRLPAAGRPRERVGLDGPAAQRDQPLGVAPKKALPPASGSK